ncbi:MAG: leucyl aminopeptidase [Clostridiales bacterium]|nr:leucyl aminopeptidase [Clostridiales bacterium]
MKVSINETYDSQHIILLPVFEKELLTDDSYGINSEVKFLFESRIFEGKKEQMHYLHSGQNFLLVGLGEKAKINDQILRNLISEGFKYAKKMNFKNISYHCIDLNKVTLITESIILANYQFDKYKTVKKDNEVEFFNILKEGIVDQSRISEHVALAEATLVARVLSNEPANILTPKELSARVRLFGEEYGFEVEVLGKDGIEKENMHAYLAVTAASDEEPQFIIMRYKGNPDSKDIYGFVGKGLTYDSGGLSIKPTDSMLTMKDDMSGASAVIGMMIALSRNKVKINVTSVVAACENLISGKGYKPGDIISSRASKSIFIANTDAEGRLTLVDAIDYIIDSESIKEVVDIATLTGAAVQALGTTTTAMISTDESMKKRMFAAAEKADERIWELPLFDDYRDLVKHHEADLTNSGGKPGTMTAAAFIENFVKDVPWVHLDIAGTSWIEKDKGYLSKGATGVGVRLLYQFLKETI